MVPTRDAAPGRRLPAKDAAASIRALLSRDVSQLSDDQLRNLVAELERRFRDEALTSAAQAATIILDGVRADRWRILVGADAHKVDEMVRQSVRFFARSVSSTTPRWR